MAGEVRQNNRGATVGAVSMDANGLSGAVASVLAASVGGKYINYSDNGIVSVQGGSGSDLAAKIEKLGSLTAEDVVAATRHAALTNAMVLNTDDASAAANVASDLSVYDFSGLSADEIIAAGQGLANSSKSLACKGNTAAFPPRSS